MKNKLIKCAGGAIVLIIGIVFDNADVSAAGLGLLSVPASDALFDKVWSGLTRP